MWNRSKGREGSAGRCSYGQAERREDRGSEGRVLAGGEDRQGAAALSFFGLASDHPSPFVEFLTKPFRDQDLLDAM